MYCSGRQRALLNHPTSLPQWRVVDLVFPGMNVKEKIVARSHRTEVTIMLTWRAIILYNDMNWFEARGTSLSKKSPRPVFGGICRYIQMAVKVDVTHRG